MAGETAGHPHAGQRKPRRDERLSPGRLVRRPDHPVPRRGQGLLCHRDRAGSSSRSRALSVLETRRRPRRRDRPRAHAVRELPRRQGRGHFARRVSRTGAARDGPLLRRLGGFRGDLGDRLARFDHRGAGASGRRVFHPGDGPQSLGGRARPCDRADSHHLGAPPGERQASPERDRGEPVAEGRPAVKVGILGLGSWGTALAALLARRGYQVHGWTHDPEQRFLLRTEGENRKYLPGVRLPKGITIEDTIGGVVMGAAVVIFAVPSHALREVASAAGLAIPRQALVVNVAKGLEETSLLRMSEVVHQVRPNRQSALVWLLGPSHAEEVSRDHPTALVAAGLDPEAARRVQAIFNGETLRVYTSPDVVGVELAAGLKNVIAIAAGISFGVGFGDNSFGALVTRGLAEITRLGVVLGGRPETFAGLSGLGDLVTTCCSQHSRNRWVGEQIGMGKKLHEILLTMTMIAEGVETTRSAYSLAQQCGVEMPITREVYRVLFEGKAPLEAIEHLMGRALKAEIWQ